MNNISNNNYSSAQNKRRSQLQYVKGLITSLKYLQEKCVCAHTCILNICCQFICTCAYMCQQVIMYKTEGHTKKNVITVTVCPILLSNG